MNNFKEWNVLENLAKELCLWHKCPFTYENRNVRCYKNKDNKWICTMCGKNPPEEVALFADLCFCDPLTIARSYKVAFSK